MNVKYTKELLADHVPHCTSFAGLARSIGIKPTGSNTTNLRKRCEKFHVDFNHFTGQSHRKGKVANNKKSAQEVLVCDSSKHVRRKRDVLHRALQEINTPYECNSCGQRPFWNGKELTLQIDHINGEWWDNRRENLQYICPNCHTQTETWGSRNK